MKEVVFTSFVPVDPETLWGLRNSFELDRYIAEREDREIRLHSQQDEASEHGTLTRRTSHCRLKSNPLPPWARSLVDAELALQTVIESSWYAERFDEERCCRFRITTRDPRLDGKFEILCRQWLVRVDGGCTLTARIRFSVRIAVVGPIAESLLAKQFSKSCGSFPSYLDAYLKDHPAALSAPRCVEGAEQGDPEMLTLCLDDPVEYEKRAGARAGRSVGCPVSCWQRLRSLLFRRPRAHILPLETV